MKSQRRFIHSIRFKLLLIALTLLVIPWAGYRYIQETERFLRQTQEDLLLSIAQAVAAILNESPAMLESSGSGQARSDEPLVYLNPLTHPIQVDGYGEEWGPYLKNLQHHRHQGETQFESLLGEYQGHLYLYLRIFDHQLVPLPPRNQQLDQADHVDLLIGNLSGEQTRYRITLGTPGWVPVYRVPNRTGNEQPPKREYRIQGELQINDQGYTLELKVPRYLLASHLAIQVSDVDREQGRLLKQTFSSTGRGDDVLARMIRPDPAIERRIGGLEHDNARIWVLNRQRQVLARRGSLQPPDTAQPEVAEFSPLQPLLRLILDQPSRHFEDDVQRNARLGGAEIDAALKGSNETRRRTTPDGRAVILSAAWPIESKGEVVGAVVVEQSTNRILTLQNEAMQQTLAITLPLLLLIGLALLGFASLLTARIHRLRNRVEEAVTTDGRILHPLPPDTRRDEIGDLSRSFSGVLNRLSEYNRYLETMASRLAHEFRTPLTIVQSSLEHLRQDHSAEEQTRYLERAHQGAERLNVILQRMREATRLEQQLQQVEVEVFNPVELLRLACEGYRQAFPGVVFELDLPAQPVRLTGAPDLIIQALDKLVSNAVDFHLADTAIILGLKVEGNDQFRISVLNRGPSLPKETTLNLFESMVSVRQGSREEPHLGLGLYLVRLICEFHQGRAEAHNLKDGSGVLFTLHLSDLATAAAIRS